jgi:uncharacterized membrane protein YozB (DUF420 family)
MWKTKATINNYTVMVVKYNEEKVVHFTKPSTEDQTQQILALYISILWRHILLKLINCTQSENIT